VLAIFRFAAAISMDLATARMRVLTREMGYGMLAAPISRDEVMK
jgi:hypothetical protein